MPVRFWSELLSLKDYMGSEVWEMNLKMINREAALDLLKLEFAIEEPEICRGTDVPEPPKEAGGVKPLPGGNWTGER